LYLATRSERAGAPVLIWPAFTATAISAMGGGRGGGATGFFCMSKKRKVFASWIFKNKRGI